MWRAFLAVTGLALGGVGNVRAEGDEAAEPIGTVIGIDLGTTYSCVGVFKGGRVEIIANDQGNRITPSYVAWDSNGERLIGDAAKNQATVNPETTVFDVKRLIGRQFGDKSVQADMKLFPFKIVNRENKPNVQVRHIPHAVVVACVIIGAILLRGLAPGVCIKGIFVENMDVCGRREQPRNLFTFSSVGAILPSLLPLEQRVGNRPSIQRVVADCTTRLVACSARHYT